MLQSHAYAHARIHIREHLNTVVQINIYLSAVGAAGLAGGRGRGRGRGRVAALEGVLLGRAHGHVAGVLALGLDHDLLVRVVVQAELVAVLPLLGVLEGSPLLARLDGLARAQEDLRALVAVDGSQAVAVARLEELAVACSVCVCVRTEV